QCQVRAAVAPAVPRVRVAVRAASRDHPGAAGRGLPPAPPSIGADRPAARCAAPPPAGPPPARRAAQRAPVAHSRARPPLIAVLALALTAIGLIGTYSY